MTLKIISNEERVKTVTGVKMVIFGPYGIGKTSLLKTLDESTTLCLDFEAGLLAVQDWKGDSISVRTWNEARDIACLIGGPNPALKSDQAYSQRHYEHVSGKYKDLSSEFFKYHCIFIDSITVASRLCFLWARMQPEAFSDRSGREDKRAAYGTLAQEMMAWLNQFQHIRDKDIIIVGTLGQYLDDCNRPTWLPQCEGAKTASEIPGIVDEVISMVGIKKDDGTEVRSFVCQKINSWGYPAKDRSGLYIKSKPQGYNEQGVILSIGLIDRNRRYLSTLLALKNVVRTVGGSKRSNHNPVQHLHYYLIIFIGTKMARTVFMGIDVSKETLNQQ